LDGGVVDGGRDLQANHEIEEHAHILDGLEAQEHDGHGDFDQGHRPRPEGLRDKGVLVAVDDVLQGGRVGVGAEGVWGAHEEEDGVHQNHDLWSVRDDVRGEGRIVLGNSHMPEKWCNRPMIDGLSG